MLGRELVRQLSVRMNVVGSTVSSGEDTDWLIRNVDVSRSGDFERVMDRVRPDAVVNCAGIVKSECESIHASRVWDVNARAPHALATIAGRRGARFVHVSTDCVFSGHAGRYREYDTTDAEDTYGKSKAAGEVVGPHDCLTIRTSFIGLDPRRRRGLLEWLIAQGDGVVPGFARAGWSGLSSPELARAIGLALDTPSLSGLYHVTGPIVSKADLLEALVREMGLPCRVERVEGPRIDRSLDGSKFANATGYASPTWVEMARELA
jgi:dTDP-4-dehydrorhamnose reductase